MLSRITGWFAFPVFPDNPDKTRRARLLDGAIAAMASLSLMFLVANALGGQSPLSLYAIDVANLVLCLPLHHWTRAGHVRLTGIAGLAIASIDITIAAALLGTIRTPTTAIYFVVVIGAGLLFDRAGVLISTAFCSLAVLGLIGAENAHWLPTPNWSVTLTQWATYTSLFAFIGGLTLFALDTTRRALAAAHTQLAERKKIERELKTQRDFALQVMDAMGQGLTVTDSDGRFEFINPAYARLLDRDPHDLVGRRPRDITLPDDYPVLDRAHSDRLQGKTTTYETHVLRNDGSQVTVLITSAPRWQNGHVAGAIAVITDLTEQKQVEARLRYLGTHDPLTGTYNRAFFETELERLESSRAFPVSIIVVDVDNLKAANDTLGHSAGDELLKRTATVLQSGFRSSDIITRIGGDEFALLLPATSAVTAQHIVERIRQALAASNAEQAALPLSLSLGVATADYGQLVQTFQTADARMYADKRAHRSAA